MDKFVSKGNGKQVTLPSMVKDRSKPCMDICTRIYEEILPFVVESIGEYGKGLPS